MKAVYFASDYYENGIVKYEAGSYHPLCSDTQGAVSTDYAELVDAADLNAVDLAAFIDSADKHAANAEKRSADADALAIFMRAEADAAIARVAGHPDAERVIQ